ncbi:MAG: 3-dehydroquinate synthase [Phycisphaerae bacterium]|jgi:3-dehydroquinate synthase
MAELTIHGGNTPSNITVKVDVLSSFGELLRGQVTRSGDVVVGLITDSRVGPLYGSTVLRSLRDAGFKVFTQEVPAGESTKTLDTAGSLYELLAQKRFTRDGVLVALGGGVVSDLTGYVAGTWMRGSGFAIVPTTLEADIDASIGGKTAVNLPSGKNLVGVFHQPCLVAIDPKCLRTLDVRDVRAGMAESVKHALIASDEFLRWHEEHVDKILALEAGTITELILRNVRIKARIVEQDALEQTRTRMLLNFGHTIGHAIESCAEFALRHGECVALGMLAACHLSQAMDLLDRSAVRRVGRVLASFGLPPVVDSLPETDRVVEIMQNDKKVRGGQARFVVLQGIGRPVVRDDIPESLVREAYESLIR